MSTDRWIAFGFIATGLLVAGFAIGLRTGRAATAICVFAAVNGVDAGVAMLGGYLVAGALDLVLCIGAAACAVTNAQNAWLGGTAWTVGLALAACWWLLGVSKLAVALRDCRTK